MSMGRIVFEKTINGVDSFAKATTLVNANLGELVKIVPGVGKWCYYWDTIPAGTIIAVDDSRAFIVTADAAANYTAMMATNANVPYAEVLTYAT